MQLEVAVDFGGELLLFRWLGTMPASLRSHARRRFMMRPPLRRESGRGWRWSAPSCALLVELSAACSGELVELGFAVVLGYAPLGGDGAFLLEFEEGWVEGSVVEREDVSAGLLDAAGDAVAVEWTHGFEGLEDHQC